MSEIFVFGSNLAGRHGKGAARDAAKYYAAEMGVGVGRTGYAYAIPTKDENLKTLPIEVISKYAWEFAEYARGNPKLTFHLTPIGTGLAGHSKREIWKMFSAIGLPENVFLTSSWMTH